MGQRKKNKKTKKISGLFLRVFVLVFVVAVAVGIGRQAARYQEVKDETASVAAQVKEEKEKQQECEARREYYTSDAYIEQIAREQLGMVKSNEILYINRGE